MTSLMEWSCPECSQANSTDSITEQSYTCRKCNTVFAVVNMAHTSDSVVCYLNAFDAHLREFYDAHLAAIISDERKLEAFANSVPIKSAIKACCENALGRSSRAH